MQRKLLSVKITKLKNSVTFPPKSSMLFPCHCQSSLYVSSVCVSIHFSTHVLRRAKLLTRVPGCKARSLGAMFIMAGLLFLEREDRHFCQVLCNMLLAVFRDAVTALNALCHPKSVSWPCTPTSCIKNGSFSKPR